MRTSSSPHGNERRVPGASHDHNALSQPGGPQGYLLVHERPGGDHVDRRGETAGSVRGSDSIGVRLQRAAFSRQQAATASWFASTTGGADWLWWVGGLEAQRYAPSEVPRLNDGVGRWVKSQPPGNQDVQDSRCPLPLSADRWFLSLPLSPALVPRRCPLSLSPARCSLPLPLLPAAVPALMESPVGYDGPVERIVSHSEHRS